MSRLDDGANKIASAMAWFWGAYTAVVTAGSLIKEPHLDLLQRVLISLPAVLLFGAYGFATWAAMPMTVSFDPRQPWEIKGSYDQTTTRRLWRLGASMTLALLAAVAVSVAVFVQLSKTPEPAEGLVITYETDRRSLLVGGVAPGNAEITVEASSAGNTQRAVGRSGKDGTFQIPIALAPNGVFTVSVKWESSDHYTTTITKAVTT